MYHYALNYLKGTKTILTLFIVNKNNSKGGIESNIYKSVMNKKNYTLSNFRKDC
jgi:hypothetical protein